MFWLGMVIGMGLGGAVGVAFMAIFQASKAELDDAVFTRKNDRE